MCCLDQRHTKLVGVLLVVLGSSAHQPTPHRYVETRPLLCWSHSCQLDEHKRSISRLLSVQMCCCDCLLFVQDHPICYSALTTSRLAAAQLPGWCFRQGPTVSSPVPARGGVASFRLLGSRSTGGIALRSGSTTTPCKAQGEDGTTAGDVPSPSPRTGNKNIEPKVEGRSATTEEREVSRPREEAVDQGAGQRANPAGGQNSPSTGRGDTGLLVKTGTPILNVSDWSLTSCDDVDDGAVRRQRVTSCVFS